MGKALRSEDGTHSHTETIRQLAGGRAGGNTELRNRTHQAGLGHLKDSFLCLSKSNKNKRKSGGTTEEFVSTAMSQLHVELPMVFLTNICYII